MSDELKRKFNLLSEYAFVKDNSYNQPNDELDKTLLEDDEDPLDGIDFGDEEGGDTPEGDAPEDGEMESDDLGDDMGGDEPAVEPAVEPQPGEESLDGEDEDFPIDDMDDVEAEESEDGDIELDVTDLVQGSEDAKASADEANGKIDQLLGSIEQLLQTTTKIDALGQRMSDIENEIIKRNPTKDEKLEMQSLHSAPYTVKVQDYWADKQDYIEDVAKTGPTFNDIDQPEAEKEMVLTQKKVDDTYSELNVKNTFDYEEEDVDDYNV